MSDTIHAQESEPKIAKTPISLTDAAAEEMRRVMAQHKAPEGYKLRIGITAGGCSGFNYALNYDMVHDTDEQFTSNGIEMILDKRQAMFLIGTTIDFTDGLQGRGFKFDNPNSSHSCGCGNSFH